ncbi:MAG TPA: hypothetical protein PK280_19455 [Planctomycetota bacterium]|nr:hypothetical protein [Planctomycetota bacterium]
MATMLGQTKSWVWWLAGALCAMVFSAAAKAGEMVAKYGVRPIRPPIDNPAITDEQKQKVEKLLADYLTPPAAGEPAAELKATVEKLVKDFASADFKTREDASVQAAKQGPAALGLFREAAKSKDPEVASRAGAAAAAIENAARLTTVEELKKVQAAASQVIFQKLAESRAAQAKANEAAAAADKAGNADEAAKARAEAAKCAERTNALSSLQRQIMPAAIGTGPGGGAVALYGVRAPEPID